jgi:hypothetical protein
VQQIALNFFILDDPSNVTIQYTSDPEELWEGNGNITITCNADCNPKCHYRLFHNGSSYWVYYNGGWYPPLQTTIIDMDRKKSGNYTCAAWNSVERSPVNSINAVKLHIKCMSNINNQFYVQTILSNFLLKSRKRNLSTCK